MKKLGCQNSLIREEEGMRKNPAPVLSAELLLETSMNEKGQHALRLLFGPVTSRSSSRPETRK